MSRFVATSASPVACRNESATAVIVAIAMVVSRCPGGCKAHLLVLTRATPPTPLYPFIPYPFTHFLVSPFVIPPSACRL
jgi:hypothetical protein